MNDFYRIDETTLNNIKEGIMNEHNSFNDYTKNNISTSYLNNCSDSSVTSMKNKINEYSNKIEKGYSSIEKWLNDYISDVNGIEQGLISGENNIKDSELSRKMDSFLKNEIIEIEVSPVLEEFINKKPKYETLPLITNKNSSPSNPYETLPFITGPEEQKNKVELYSAIQTLSETQSDPNTNNNTVIIDDKITDIVGKMTDELKNVYSSEIADRRKPIEAYLKTLYEKQETLKASIEELKKDFEPIVNYIVLGPQGNYADWENQREKYEKLAEEFKEIEKKVKQNNGVFTEEEMAKLTPIQKEYLLYLELNDELLGVNKRISEVEQELERIPYDVLSETEDYKNFANSYSLEKEYDEIMATAGEFENHEADYDWYALYQAYSEYGFDIPDGIKDIKIGEINAVVDVKIFDKYATDEEKMMYHYIYKNLGYVAANKYVTTLLPRINEQAGRDMANEDSVGYYYEGVSDPDNFYKVLSFVATLTKVTEKGIVNALDEFNEKLESCSVSKKIMTPEEWKRIYESEYIRNVGFGFYYDVVMSTTKMLPSMALGGMAGAALDFGAIGSIIYSSSIYGAYHDEAVRMGLSDVDAFNYALFHASSTFVVEYVFKNTPGLSGVNWNTSFLKKLSKTSLAAALKVCWDQKVDSIFLGKKWDFTELTGDALYAALVAAYSFCLTQGPSAIKNINDVVITYKQNGQEKQIKGVKGIQKVLTEADIIEVPEGKSIEITPEELSVAKADMEADSGKIVEIKIDDISKVTTNTYESIKNKNNVLFRLPDGRMLDYNGLNAMLAEGH